MSKKIDDGGAAFPFLLPKVPGIECELDKGMTLRDWFAGMALTGLISDPTKNYPPNDYAGRAYRMADAMIKSRKEVHR